MSSENKILFMEQCIAKYGKEFIPYAIFDLPYLLEENAVTMLSGEVKKLMKKK